MDFENSHTANFPLWYCSELCPTSLACRDGAKKGVDMKLLDSEGLKQKGIKYSAAHRWRLIKAGRFPKPVKLGLGRNAWVDEEIDAYIAALVAKRDSTAPEAA
jgi:prophage regulatory protein